MSVTTAVQRSCDSAFRSVQEVLEANLKSGEELGASIVINLDGENVVDLWGGWRDEARTQPWEQDTIVNVWSTTKTVTSLAVHLLASRGQVEVYARVALSAVTLSGQVGDKQLLSSDAGGDRAGLGANRASQRGAR